MLGGNRVAVCLLAAVLITSAAGAQSSLASKEVKVDRRGVTRISLRQDEGVARIWVSTVSREFFFPDRIELQLDGALRQLRCLPEIVTGETLAFFGGGGPTCARPSASYCDLPAETLDELLAAEHVGIRIGAGGRPQGQAVLTSRQAKRLRTLR